jgi:16S rRNA U1498 N3-methylase RsmE
VVPDLLPAQPLAAAVAQATARGLTVVAYEVERRHTLRAVLTANAPRPGSLPAAEPSAGGGGEPSGPGGNLAEDRRTVALFVGPEGGFEPSEAEQAEASGAHLVTLGPRILRTETASPVLAALVLYELGDLSSPPP